MMLLNYNSYLFADVDECEINGTCSDHSTCANTFGSFLCTCNEGFMKSGSVCIGKIVCSFEYAVFRYLFTEDLNELIFLVNSPQMWMNVRSMGRVQNTPPVQTHLALLYAPAMKAS